MLDHFGPSLKSPWTRLDAPALTRELRDAVVEGCDKAAAGKQHRRAGGRADRAWIAVQRASGQAGGARDDRQAGRRAGRRTGLPDYTDVAQSGVDRLQRPPQ